jgi:hypothetical protein
MHRRDFLKAALSGLALCQWLPVRSFAACARPPCSRPYPYDEHLREYLIKMRNFDKPHKGDFCLEPELLPVLSRTVNRLKRLQRIVGYGNFHLLDFDYALLYARNYSSIGDFPKDELDFLEMIFYTDARTYGFYGEKPLKNLSDRVQEQNVTKIPGTGHYIYRGESLELYRKIKKEIGDDLILTSGVRGVIKQFLLFLNKADKNRGNLSLASRQLAPPGYSFHGTADFDVGKGGFGAANFTARFMRTDVYKRLKERGYLMLRYPQDNMLGVRFEPWHIKVS